jgi:ketosteroid isomerase-like protein
MNADTQRRDDEIQIRALLDDRAAAFRAKDARQYVTAFALSIVKFDLAPPPQETGASSLNHLAGTRTDGEYDHAWTRSTLGLRKIDGAWKITHEHNSAPFYMDGSDRPASI